MARPKRVFTDEQEALIMDSAFNGCQNNTIATLLCIPISTLTRRFGKLMTEIRAERKAWLRKVQNRRAMTDASGAVAIFLGKNELNQTDKQIIEQVESRPQLTPEEIARYKLITRGLLRKGA